MTFSGEEKGGENESVPGASSEDATGDSATTVPAHWMAMYGT